MKKNTSTPFICIPVFVFFSLYSVSVYAQEKTSPLSFEASAGISILHGKIKDSGFPFGLAGDGFGLQVGANYRISKSIGLSLHFSNSIHPYDINTAAAHLLEQDPFAYSLMVRSGDYSISLLTGGAFYKWDIHPRWSVRLAANAGMSIVQTPRIRAAVLTEPNTVISYEIGRTSGFTWRLGVQPQFSLNDRLSLMLDLSWDQSSPEITVFDHQDLAFTQDISYSRLGLSVGMVYQISRNKGRTD